MRDKSSDIVLLQENHSSNRTATIWKNEWGGQVTYSHGNTNGKGVAIMFRHGVEHKISKVSWDTRCRLLITDILIEEQKIMLANTYTPNSDEPNYFITALDMLDKHDYPHK